MKKIFLLFFVFLLSVSSVISQVNFDDYFYSKSLRIDYNLVGNNVKTEVYLVDLKQETFWGGSQKNLVDKFNYGEYRVMVYDSAYGKLIYSRGYTSLFQEWRATAEAKYLSRSYYETVLIPYPKNAVRIVIQARNKELIFEDKFTFNVDPRDYLIIKDNSLPITTKKIFYSGDPKQKLDVVIIPEGYSKDDLEKMNRDAEKFASTMFGCSPYKENKDNFNIWLVQAISQESGVDIPHQNIWKNTVLNSHFYTFRIDRYLMTTDIKSLRDLAGLVPYDQIVIIVNSEKYGGGGVYNYYSMYTADNRYMDYVAVHEFGHAFACLADEYYDSEVAVEDYINLKVEPYEPNITTLVDFDKKWKNLVDKNTPIPTPPEKQYWDKVGVFEGGSYVAKGIFRPMYDCTMKSIKYDSFCRVCYKALDDMIKFYSE